MAFAHLVMTGSLSLNGTDVSAQCSSFVFRAVRDVIEIAPTLQTDPSVAGGPVRFQADVNFFQDVDATAITRILWTAITGSTGTVTLAGRMRTGAVSATNPTWTATALVPSVSMGGQQWQVATDSVTFPLTAEPVITTS